MFDIAIILVIIFTLVLIWNRFGPHDRDRWHSDPADDENIDAPVQLYGTQAPRFAGDADDVLAELVRIVRAERGVKIMDGSIDEGMITFVAYSTILCLRDYVTVKAAYEGDVTKLSIAARPKSNLIGGGRNEARVERWLQALRRTFGE